jgi:nucleoid-associated protein YgaU
MDEFKAAKDLLKPAKAKLVVIDGNGPDEDKTLECMFNPTEYRLSQNVEVSRESVAARPGGKAQYVGTTALTLTMQLFFDDFASANGDVTPKISTLLKWQHPTSKSMDGKRPVPPLIRFEWGNTWLSTFQGVLTSVDVSYTLFRKDGTPIQAKVDITIEGAGKVVALPNPTSHAIDSRRVRILTEGDSLQSIAYQELGNATYWRAIAELNGIDDPLRLAAGRVVLIPTVADAARSA